MKKIWKRNNNLTKKLDQQINEEFNTNTFVKHEFSNEYIEKKKKLLESMDVEKLENNISKDNLKIRKLWSKPAKVAAIVLAAVIVCSTSVFAINSINHKSKHDVTVEKKGEYGVDLVIKPTDDKDNSKNTSYKTEPRYWKLNKSYLPAGEAPVAGYDDEKYHIDGIDGGEDEILFLLYDIGRVDQEIRLSNYSVLLSESTEINGVKVLYNEYGTCTDSYIYFEDCDCIVRLYTNGSIKKDEVIKIIEGLSITPGTANDCTEVQSLTQLIINYDDNTNTFESYEKSLIKDINEEEIKITNVGGCFTEKTDDLSVFDSDGFKKLDMQYTIDDLAVYDNFHDIGDGNLTFSKECTKIMDENGNVLPDHLKYIKKGDGVNSVDTAVYEEDVAQKLVCIKFRMKNVSNENYGSNVMRLNMAKMLHSDGKYKIIDGIKDIECDRIEHSAMGLNNEMIYYDFKDSMGYNGIESLKAGEEKTFTVVFCVDEPDLPYLYINFNQYGSGSKSFYSTESPQYKPEVFNYVKVMP